jgi:hypothetical protein
LLDLSTDLTDIRGKITQAALAFFLWIKLRLSTRPGGCSGAVAGQVYLTGAIIRSLYYSIVSRAKTHVLATQFV